MKVEIFEFPIYDHDLWKITFRKRIYYVLTLHQKDILEKPKALEVVRVKNYES